MLGLFGLHSLMSQCVIKHTLVCLGHVCVCAHMCVCPIGSISLDNPQKNTALSLPKLAISLYHVRLPLQINFHLALDEYGTPQYVIFKQ